MAWDASSDDVKVAGYRTYKESKYWTTRDTSATFGIGTPMTCGTTYTLGVSAYDAAGNVSARSDITAATAPCTTTDTAPPSTPGALSTTVAAASATLSWAAASDNVGVTSYSVYRDGTPRRHHPQHELHRLTARLRKQLPPRRGGT